MNSRDNIHHLLLSISKEIFSYIKEHEHLYADGWVPASKIKQDLELNLICTPKSANSVGGKGWLFGAMARILEDKEQIEMRKVRFRSYLRAK